VLVDGEEDEFFDLEDFPLYFNLPLELSRTKSTKKL
jgi:hypothetical protein